MTALDLKQTGVDKSFVRKILTILFWIVVICLSLYFYFKAVPNYFTGELSQSRLERRWWFVIHFSGATATLFLGPLQFVPFIRKNFPRIHRTAGKIYIGGSIVSALMVFYLLKDYPLPGSIPSLGLLAVIWILTTVMAFWFATKKNFKLHREFMIRSYVCGFAFVFIRLLPVVNTYTGIFDFMTNQEVKWTVYEWICWVYPLMVVEFCLVWWPSITKFRATLKAS